MEYNKEITANDASDKRREEKNTNYGSIASLSLALSLSLDESMIYVRLDTC